MRLYHFAGAAAAVLLAAAGIAAYRTSSVEMTPMLASTITSGYGGLYTKSADGRPRLVSSAGSEFRAGTATDVSVSAGVPGAAALGWCWMDSTDSYRLWCKESAGNLRQRFDAASPGSIGCTSASPGCFSAVTIAGAPTDATFHRVCTISSATALTPVNCLTDADVPATKRAYVSGWHLKVNGATAWGGGITQCWIQDTAGVTNFFITVANAAMTGNSFVADHSASVTQNNAYALAQGSTLDRGIEIACDANGTGSDAVITVFGVIK